MGCLTPIASLPYSEPLPVRPGRKAGAGRLGDSQVDYRTWKELLRRACDIACEEYPDEEEMAILFEKGLTYKQALDLIIDERT